MTPASCRVSYPRGECFAGPTPTPPEDAPDETESTPSQRRRRATRPGNRIWRPADRRPHPPADGDRCSASPRRLDRHRVRPPGHRGRRPRPAAPRRWSPPMQPRAPRSTASSASSSVIQRARFVLQQARGYGLGGAHEIPFTLAAGAPPLPPDAPGSASLRLGAPTSVSPLERWLTVLFGPGD